MYCRPGMRGYTIVCKGIEKVRVQTMHRLPFADWRLLRMSPSHLDLGFRLAPSQIAKHHVDQAAYHFPALPASGQMIAACIQSSHDTYHLTELMVLDSRREMRHRNQPGGLAFRFTLGPVSVPSVHHLCDNSISPKDICVECSTVGIWCEEAIGVAESCVPRSS